MITLRTEAGGRYGIGHAMRLRAIAQALHRLAPDVPLQVLGASPELDTVFDCCQPWAPVYLGVNHQPHDVLVVDLPQHDGEQDAILLDTQRHTLPLTVVYLDAPWATSAMCDVLILPGLHHNYSIETLSRCAAAFGPALYYGAAVTVLPAALPERMPYTVRQQCLTFYAGGSDPHGLLAQLYAFTRPLVQMLPGVLRCFLRGRVSPLWPSMTPLLGTDDTMQAFHPWQWATSSLAIGSWGITPYECLAAGTPVLVVPQSAAQAADAARAEIATRGAIRSLGVLGDTTPEAFSQWIARLWHDVTTRLDMHRQSLGRLDRDGSTRIAEILLASWRHHHERYNHELSERRYSGGHMDL